MICILILLIAFPLNLQTTRSIQSKHLVIVEFYLFYIDPEWNHFTLDPSQLKGKQIKTRLKKGKVGLGFNIIGADMNSNEFIQITRISPGGSADIDGTLQIGD